AGIVGNGLAPKHFGAGARPREGRIASLSGSEEGEATHQQKTHNPTPCFPAPAGAVSQLFPEPPCTNGIGSCWAPACSSNPKTGLSRALRDPPATLPTAVLKVSVNKGLPGGGPFRKHARSHARAICVKFYRLDAMGLNSPAIAFPRRTGIGPPRWNGPHVSAAQRILAHPRLPGHPAGRGHGRCRRGTVLRGDGARQPVRGRADRGHRV